MFETGSEAKLRNDARRVDPFRCIHAALSLETTIYHSTLHVATLREKTVAVALIVPRRHTLHAGIKATKMPKGFGRTERRESRPFSFTST